MIPHFKRFFFEQIYIGDEAWTHTQSHPQYKINLIS